ncbi:hypothetical protein G432_05050 [Sphingomonas sp. MM-1]|uniref:hypothetical protein n=1 Tax=Sphingomonas sp. MM-1 TaxID=745310 RepID=UPI0002C12D45|nr:hypothetical protein [Sphingomonas sp. MM-1]AGH48737.1 hypothetical protein G432_05050 [Sphingomonas sp. MM-1]
MAGIHPHAIHSGSAVRREAERRAAKMPITRGAWHWLFAPRPALPGEWAAFAVMNAITIAIVAWAVLG